MSATSAPDWIGTSFEDGGVATDAAEEQSLAVTAQRQTEDRRLWQETIDNKLIEWGRNPGQLEDEDITPPSAEIVGLASRFSMKMRDLGFESPNRVVPNGEGGIVFERCHDTLSETIEIFEDGSFEYALFQDCRLIQRGILNF